MNRSSSFGTTNTSMMYFSTLGITPGERSVGLQQRFTTKLPSYH